MEARERDRGKAEQQRHGENRRWLIVTRLLRERESHRQDDQWQWRKWKQECRDRFKELHPVIPFSVDHSIG